MFFVYSYYLNNAVPKDKNFIEISRNIFDKVDAGEVKLQYATNNPVELANFFKDKVDFNVFIPDIKDAELVGGVYNEINGQKLVHFVHKCGNKLIYTMEGHQDYVNSAIFSPDGKYIVTSSKDGTAIVWETITGKIYHSLL